MIRFRCQQCRGELGADGAHAGQAGTCSLCGAAVAAPGLGVAEAVTNFVPPVVPAAQSDLETGRRGRWTKPMLVCGVAITAPGVVLGMLAVLLLLVSLALSWSALARMLWGFWRLLTGHETEQAGLR